jgi:hypothetical protein
MAFLSPTASLIALAVVIPLAAYALLERRTRRVSSALGLTPPPLRTRLGVPAAIAAVAGLLGIAAAQPVISGNRTETGRADAEVFMLFDISRSMLARHDSGSPTRLNRAKSMAQAVRTRLSDIPVGIASMTDRTLPHLFPTLDAQVFTSTLRHAISIERPPPAGTNNLATDFNSLGDFGPNNYFSPQVKKRLVIVYSDGESRSFDDVVLASKFRDNGIRVLFVHLWNSTEKIFLRKNRPDVGYRPDPESVREAERLAAAGDGTVIADGDTGALVTAAKAILGSGPSTKLREQRTRVSLAPFVALAALVPLGFVFLRRNI